MEPGQDEISLPKATVQKIIGEILPRDYSFTKDAREALIECCIEFLMIVSTESNDIADKELKKTISTDHVMSALENLGFGDYVSTLNEFIDQFKINNKIKERRIGNKFQNSGMTEEELLKKQEELFKASRDKLRQQNT
ncbi:DEKNAAC100682 [Brettanomyces naardenensis]|uniref:DEKNAAC100682 n=1 Tax=Brettanomyces naardenensis TaxID=13370 RepID=A0A448YFY1_BRENA|nr:DEKNAAC100682 [Brettanomyces naardenensis]